MASTYQRWPPTENGLDCFTCWGPGMACGRDLERSPLRLADISALAFRRTAQFWRSAFGSVGSELLGDDLLKVFVHCTWWPLGAPVYRKVHFIQFGADGQSQTEQRNCSNLQFIGQLYKASNWTSTDNFELSNVFFSIERSQAEVELVIFPRKQMYEASCSAKARESRAVLRLLLQEPYKT